MADEEDERRQGFIDFQAAISDLKGDLSTEFTTQIGKHAEQSNAMISDIKEMVGEIRDTEIRSAVRIENLDTNLGALKDDVRENIRTTTENKAGLKTIQNHTATLFENHEEHLERIVKMESGLKSHREHHSDTKQPAAGAGAAVLSWHHNPRVQVIVAGAFFLLLAGLLILAGADLSQIKDVVPK